MNKEEDGHRTRAEREILTLAEWDESVASGQLTALDVLDRLERMALYEFGESQEQRPIAVDEEGFVTALIAEGIPVAGGVTLRVWPNDHPPPHVHIERRGNGNDIKINLETGDVEGKLPRDVRSSQLKKFSGLVEQYHELLCDWWLKNHGKAV